MDLFTELLDELQDGNNHTLVVTSDHGNVEDLSVKTHTYNPVPLIVSGPHAAQFNEITDLTGGNTGHFILFPVYRQLLVINGIQNTLLDILYASQAVNNFSLIFSLVICQNRCGFPVCTHPDEP